MPRPDFLLGLAVLGALARVGAPQSPSSAASVLDSATALTVVNGRALWTDYRGRHALHLVPLVGHEHDTDQEMMAVLTGSDFHDGVIEVDVAGARRAGYSTAG